MMQITKYGRVLPANSPVYRKRLRGSILKASDAEKTFHLDPQDHIRLMIRADRLRIAARFQNEGYMICHAIRHMKPEPTDEGKALVKAYVNERINALWTSCAMDYAEMFTMSFLDSVMPIGERTEKSAKPDYSALAETFVNTAVTALENYCGKAKSLLEGLAMIIDVWHTDSGELADELQETVSNEKFSSSDQIYAVTAMGALLGIRAMGRDRYTFVSESDEKRCPVCGGLDGQNFFIDDAKVGTNLPPIHPNCRCWIRPFPALTSSMANNAVEAAAAIVRLISHSPNIWAKFSTQVSLAGNTWQSLIGDAIYTYYTEYNTVEVDGQTVCISDAFNGVAVDHEGNIFGNPMPHDAELLELMQIRDSMRINSAEWRDAVDEIKKLWDLNGMRNGFNVDRNKRYDYYVITDVTQKLNDFMHQAEIDYEYMHKRAWQDNIVDFYYLERSGGGFDIKQQKEWMHSAFVYDGELIDRDATGNILYGYFGRFCNIPEIAMVGGAGLAQIADNAKKAIKKNGFLGGIYVYLKEHEDDIITFFDEPRDAFRILQGIVIYESTH